MPTRRGAVEPEGLLPLPESLTLATARTWVQSHADVEMRRDAWCWLRQAEESGVFDPDALRSGVQMHALGRVEGWW